MIGEGIELKIEKYRRTGDNHPALRLSECRGHRAVRCKLRFHGICLHRLPVPMFGPKGDSLLTGGTPPARPQALYHPSRQLHFNPSCRRNHIHERLQPLRYRPLPSRPLLPTPFLQAYLISDIRNCFADIPPRPLLEEGGVNVCLPRLGLVRVRMNGAVGGIIKEPNAFGCRIDGSGKGIVGAEIRGDVLSPGD